MNGAVHSVAVGKISKRRASLQQEFHFGHVGFELPV